MPERKAQFLVGADGVNGMVARELGVRTKWSPEQVALCYTANVPLRSTEVESVMETPGADESTAIELYFGLVSWGYGW